MQQFHEFTVDFDIIDSNEFARTLHNRVINEKKSARHKVQLIYFSWAFLVMSTVNTRARYNLFSVTYQTTRKMF